MLLERIVSRLAWDEFPFFCPCFRIRHYFLVEGDKNGEEDDNHDDDNADEGTW